MPGPHSMRWLFLVVVCAALTALGCTTDTQGESGSLSLELVINGDTEIDEVQWVITRGGENIKSGVINTSANGATASVEAYGLEPGDGYTITMEAVSTDEETTCKGSAMFSIEVGQVTEVHVMLNCKLPQQFGGVRVDGEFNICPSISMVVASPLQTSVGNDIDLSATANDDEGDPITYMWSSGSGIIADPMAASTIYTCTEVGDDVITILVTDDEGTYCMDMKTVDVACVAGDGDPCEGVICEDTGNECTAAACNPGTGLCETSNVADGTDCNDATGMCMGGMCVDKDLCMDVVCEDDGNECTAEVCNPSTGLCETSNVQDGTSCGDGGACMGGTCIEADLCEGVTCDDTGNDCTVGICNSQTGMCDVMNVMDGTACLDNTGTCLSGMCEVGNQCDSVICDADPTDCIDGGTCNPSNGMCEGSGNEPIDAPCDTDGVCDGEGMCVECNDGTQCPDNTNECTMAACDMNQCGQANVMNGMMCDLDGMDDGMCTDGTCVAVPDCTPATAEIDCDDGDDCTVNTCPDGMCVSQPEEDGVTCDADGTPGECVGGICVGLCDGVDCSSGNDCVDGGTCNPSNGMCEGGGNQPINTPCDTDGVCDGQGMCVECNDGTQCPDDTNECTAAACVGGTCGQANVSDGTMCDGGSGECQAGVCEPTGPPTFDLGGEFRAYNSLLKPEGDPVTCVGAPAGPGSIGGPVPPGPPVGTCTVPDLTTVPGSNTGGGAQIQAQCVTTQGIGGFLELDDGTPPAVAMSGTFTLDFAIFAIIDLSAPACETILSVDIQTSSVNAVSGTDATGGSVSAGGSVTLDDRGDGFNVDYVSTGLVTCEGQPALFAQTVCTLAGMLNALPATNPLPLPGDPGGRFWPTFTFQDNADGNLDLQFATGPTTTAGWALSNPAPLNAPGTQFIAPTGVQQ